MPRGAPAHTEKLLVAVGAIKPEVVVTLVGFPGTAIANAGRKWRMSSETSRVRPSRVVANGCRVLVVDDDADNAAMMVELLRCDGYLASSAENGAAALALLSEGFDPDLILTDLMMPVMSGWDLCEKLKQTPSYRSIPIVVTCGLAPEQRGKLQVEAAFEKPIEVESLLQKIKELCGR